MKPLISVIVPVYKVERYLEECVDSLIGQTYPHLEILLIDDGSPDNCGAMCDAFAQQDSRIRVIHKDNGGLADARNAGLDAATGDLIAFVDSDDWIDPTTYEKMVAAFGEAEDIDIVCCAASRVLNGEEVEKYFSYFPTGTVKTGRQITREILLDKIGSQVVKGLYKRFCWDGVRFPLKRLYEDIPTTFKAFSGAKKVFFIDEPFYKYRMNEVSISYTSTPIKPYHIYLGFKSHYEYAATDFTEIADLCCAKAAHYAISTYFHYCTEGSPELKPVVPDVRKFLDTHKNTVRNSTNMPKSRQVALKIYYTSNTLFKLFCKTFHLLGLQKKLGFEEK